MSKASTGATDDSAGVLGRVRRDAGRCQGAVAAALGISQAAVCKMEKSVNPCLQTIKKYAAALGCRGALRVTFPDGTVREYEF